MAVRWEEGGCAAAMTATALALGAIARTHQRSHDGDAASGGKANVGKVTLWRRVDQIADGGTVPPIVTGGTNQKGL